jgi:hypothetical protein
MIEGRGCRSLRPASRCGRAEAGMLVHEDAVEVRRYFEDLPQHPLARFIPMH